MNRRRALVVIGSAGMASLSGCSDVLDDGFDNLRGKENDEGDGENNDVTTGSPENSDYFDSDETGNGEPPNGAQGNQESDDQGHETANLEHLHGITGQTYPRDTDGSLQRRFEWSAVGNEWWFEQNIPRALDRYYSERYGRSGEYMRYVSDSYGQPIIEGLTSEFERLGTEYDLSDREVVDLTMAFVQQLQYTPDDVATEFDQYSSYPVETLINRGGDCEDTVILLAKILREMGYGCVLIGLWDAEPAHMALGVKGESSIPGTYYEYNGNRYYYVETTGEGWEVGDMPDFDGSTQAEIRGITKTPTMVYDYKTNTTKDGTLKVNANIANVSDVAATNPIFSVAFEDTSNRSQEDEAISVGDGSLLFADTTKSVTLTMEPPDDRMLRLRTTLTVDGTIHDMARSDWRDPL